MVRTIAPGVTGEDLAAGLARPIAVRPLVEPASGMVSDLCLRLRIQVHVEVV